MVGKLESLEKIIVEILIYLMAFVIFISTVRLTWRIVQEQLLVIFGFFLMVLIGLELLKSIKACKSEDKMEVEVVMAIALIALQGRRSSSTLQSFTISY